MSSTEAAEPPAPPTGAPAARRRLFAEPDFRRLWLVGTVVFVVRWVEMLAVGVFVYQQTGSAFIVAMMTMLRLLPMGLFGAFLGAAAERLERRTALLLVVASMLATSAVLALLGFLGALEVWHLGVASFLNGIGWAADNPVRRVMIGEVVGPDRMSAAMSVDVGTNNATRMVGPTVGGVLLAGVGIDGVFALSVVLYVLALVASARLRYRNAGGIAAAGPVLARMVDGLRLVRGHRRLIGALVITIIFNVFGWPFTSMVPVLGQDNLHLGAEGVGIIASMDGVGAFLGAVLVALWARPALYGRLYVGGVAAYLAMVTVFALVPSPTLAGAALLLTGLGGAGFSIMQATLVYLSAPPEMRSRVLGVLSVCIGLGPIGFVHLGVMAEAIGAQWATAATGVEGLVALLITRRLWRPILRPPEDEAALARSGPVATVGRPADARAGC